MKSDPEIIHALVMQNDERIARSQKLFSEENKRTGAKARIIREHTGVSLRLWAKEMGVSASMLSDLERGNRIWNESLSLKWGDAWDTINGVQPSP